MIKIIFSMVFVSSLAFCAAPKAIGCDLSQVGDVELNIGSKSSKKANYKAIAEVGKNFHAIFVGSVISAEGAVVTITDITSDKRVKGQPRTGVITVTLKVDSETQTVEMPYSYDKGHFAAKAKQENGEDISFAIDIKAILCHAPQKK